MRIIIAIIFVTIMAGYVFVVGLQEFKDQATISANKISFSFKRAANSLFNMESGGAQFYFSQIKEEIDSLQAQLPIFSNLIPMLKNLPPIFGNLTDLTTTASELTNKLELLKKEGAQMVIKQRGEELIQLLKDIRKDINKVNRLAKNLKAQAAEIKFDLTEEIGGINTRLYSADNFLNGFIGWLQEDEPHNLAILFQNPSEMRPAGGFIGSFAQLTLHKGNLINLEVNDIYDFDGQLEEKIIPPLPLQAVTIDWEARDANWFFDFPTSAKKVLQFLEASKIYKERDVQFDGVIAINVNVINDVLEILGPIELEEYDLILDNKNFLAEIQKEVESEKNKDVLKELTPILFEKIGQLNEEQKKKLVEVIKSRLDNKDIMIYLQDLVLESFIQNLGIGGEITGLPRDFFGEYLAVVNANIAGGKSDAFINQKIKLTSRITNDGEIINNLVISRTHFGENEKDPWYRKTNQNFIQILTPLDSELISLEGGSQKKITPAINYKKRGYKIDEDLKATEDGRQFGKEVFTSWFNVPAGKTKELNLVYKNPKKVNLINFQPRPYHFIFDKQSGVNSELEFSIEAPPGFIWKESGGPYFIYKNKNPAVKVIIELNLLLL